MQINHIAARASESLGRFLVERQTKKPVRVFGVFEKDVLVAWSLGKSSADRRAANCWNGELRTQFIGIVRPRS